MSDIEKFGVILMLLASMAMGMLRPSETGFMNWDQIAVSIVFLIGGLLFAIREEE